MKHESLSLHFRNRADQIIAEKEF